MEAALLDFQYSLIELFQSDRVFFLSAFSKARLIVIRATM